MTRHSGPAAEAFAAFTSWIHAVLPEWLRNIVPRTFIGFAMINSCTFMFDLFLLWVTEGKLGIPHALAVSISFGIAATIAFFLNKFLNFRARGNVGKQSARYVLVLISNYLIWLVGFSTLLVWLGVHYMLSRILAGIAEGIYIYLCSRLWVFKQRRTSPDRARSA